MKKSSRFRLVDPQRFRAIRMNLGWSQEELCRRSGYSERLIRKAEAGGSLKVETIKDLAEAMSRDGSLVSIDDLTFSSLFIVREFVQGYDAFGANVVDRCRQWMSDDIEFHCSADPTQMPFAGIWLGLDGMRQFFDRFFQTFSRKSNSLDPTYFVGASLDGDAVIARFQERVIYQGHELPPYDVNLHFSFRGGKIGRIDDQFDHHKASSDFAALRKNLNISG